MFVESHEVVELGKIFIRVYAFLPVRQAGAKAGYLQSTIIKKYLKNHQGQRARPQYR